MTKKMYQAILYLNTEAEGGRKTPPRSGYRPNIFFGLDASFFFQQEGKLKMGHQPNQHLNSDGRLLYDQEYFPMGTYINCFLAFSNYNPTIEPYLYEDAEFYICEMKHVVGRGKILYESKPGLDPFRNKNEMKDAND